MTQEEQQKQWITAQAMRYFGGYFAACLAKAWMAADPDNKATITTAFSDLWEEYSIMAERLNADKPDWIETVHSQDSIDA